jgi:hypothetical protein
MSVLGVALFTHAQALTASATFRLGAGALTFASGAVLVLVFILMRSVPHKRKLLTAAAVSASSVAAAVRWAYGTWAPDLGAILTSRAALTYFLVTGLLGLAVTYWLDDTSNVKLNNTVSGVLHLSGLLLVFLGTTSEPASFCIIGLLLASRLLGPVARRVPLAARWAAARCGAACAAVAAAVRAVAAAAAANAKARRSAGADYPAAEPASPTAGVGARRRPAARRRPQSMAGLLLSEDEAAEAAEEARRVRREQEALRLREEELVAPRRQGKAGGDGAWPGGGGRDQGDQPGVWRWPGTEEAAKPAAKQQQQQQPLSPRQPAAAAPVPAVQGGGWFTRWSNPAAEPAPAAPTQKPSLLHLHAPPPESPAVRHASKQRPVSKSQQLQQRKSAAVYEDSATDESDGGEDQEQQRSPWSQEKLVVDISRPAAARRPAAASGRAATATPPTRGAGAASRTPTTAAAGSGGAGEVSPLVAMGKIFNAESSRVIHIGKGKYQDLINQGYTADLKNGVLLPPGGGGGGGGSGSGAAQATAGNVTPRRPAARASRRG